MEKNRLIEWDTMIDAYMKLVREDSSWEQVKNLRKVIEKALNSKKNWNLQKVIKNRSQQSLSG